jgi:hypothetical protein
MTSEEKELCAACGGWRSTPHECSGTAKVNSPQVHTCAPCGGKFYSVEDLVGHECVGAISKIEKICPLHGTRYKVLEGCPGCGAGPEAKIKVLQETVGDLVLQVKWLQRKLKIEPYSPFHEEAKRAEGFAEAFGQKVEVKFEQSVGFVCSACGYADGAHALACPVSSIAGAKEHPWAAHDRLLGGACSRCAAEAWRQERLFKLAEPAPSCPTCGTLFIASTREGLAEVRRAHLCPTPRELERDRT